PRSGNGVGCTKQRVRRSELRSFLSARQPPHLQHGVSTRAGGPRCRPARADHPIGRRRVLADQRSLEPARPMELRSRQGLDDRSVRRHRVQRLLLAVSRDRATDTRESRRAHSAEPGAREGSLLAGRVQRARRCRQQGGFVDGTRYQGLSAGARTMTRAIALALLAFCSALVFSMRAHAITELDGIVAVVDDDIVLASELAARLRSVRAQMAQAKVNPPPDDILLSQLLERLILESLQLQMGERAGGKIDDETLARAIDSIAKQNNMTADEFQNALAKDGVS